ncbi:hypothetical protein [Streptosporangium saharense]|uniref:Secreted protein n=1 Tax=Streptosporangium saharense TaxID=1706840 RepID=A0A7W7VNY7_9ACTN|nr:hypothetical protein [Streptosporangium saharense]MBB4916740.1 hypothetical protein [Streptosporangium saharense]
MRRAMSAALGVLAVSAAFVATTPGSASAGAGTFSYETQSGTRVLNNPHDLRCYPVGYAKGDAINGTNRLALLYPSPYCDGAPVGYVPSGDTLESAEFGSVRFVRAN